MGLVYNRASHDIILTSIMVCHHLKLCQVKHTQGFPIVHSCIHELRPSQGFHLGIGFCARFRELTRFQGYFIIDLGFPLSSTLHLAPWVFSSTLQGFPPWHLGSPINIQGFIQGMLQQCTQISFLFLSMKTLSNMMGNEQHPKFFPKCFLDRNS